LRAAPEGAPTEAYSWSACADLHKGIPPIIELIRHAVASYIKMNSHSGVACPGFCSGSRYTVRAPAFAGMTTWIPHRVGNDMPHFHALL